MESYNTSKLINECNNIAQLQCQYAIDQNIDINTLVHRFKMLAHINLFDIEDWSDAQRFISMALFQLSLFNAMQFLNESKNKLVC